LTTTKGGAGVLLKIGEESREGTELNNHGYSNPGLILVPGIMTDNNDELADNQLSNEPSNLPSQTPIYSTNEWGQLWDDDPSPVNSYLSNSSQESDFECSDDEYETDLTIPIKFEDRLICIVSTKNQITSSQLREDSELSLFRRNHQLLLNPHILKLHTSGEVFNLSTDLLNLVLVPGDCFITYTPLIIGGKKKKLPRTGGPGIPVGKLGKVSGSGDYKVIAKRAAESAKGELSKMIQKKLSSLTGSDMLGRVGRRAFDGGATSIMKKIFGNGDYQYSDTPAVNSLFKGSSDGDSAQGTFDTKHFTRLKGREFIKPLYTSATQGVPVIELLEVNPGLSTTFPWLSSVADNYQQYRWRGLVFEVVTTSSAYSSQGAIGNTVMTCNYNASQPAYTSQISMQNSDEAISFALYNGGVFGVECKSGSNPQNSYYVRTGSEVTTAPVTSTDMLSFQYGLFPATSYPASSQVGLLYVSYDIELWSPAMDIDPYGYASLTGTLTYGGISTVPAYSMKIGQMRGNCRGIYLNTTSLGQFSVYFPNARTGDIFQIVGTMFYGNNDDASLFNNFIYPLVDLKVFDRFRVYGGAYSECSPTEEGSPDASYSASAYTMNIKCGDLTGEVPYVTIGLPQLINTILDVQINTIFLTINCLGNGYSEDQMY